MDVSRPVLQDLYVVLWPAEALPTSFFGLSANLQDVIPHVNSSRRSSFFDGARRAYACVKTHFQKVDAVTVATPPPQRTSLRVDRHTLDMVKHLIEVG